MHQLLNENNQKNKSEDKRKRRKPIYLNKGTYGNEGPAYGIGEFHTSIPIGNLKRGPVYT